MKRALVTGSAKGLGREIVLALADANYHPIIHYRSSRKEAFALAEVCLQKGVSAEVIQGDFSTLDSTQAFLQKISCFKHEIAVLVNNVGSYNRFPLLKTPIEVWLETFHANFHAPRMLVQELLEGLIHNKGSIINIGVAGIEKRLSDSYTPAYTMSKAALLMLTKTLAKELAPQGVRVNMVSPGWLENSVHLPADPLSIPMGRVGTLKEVAEIIKTLISPAFNYMTGQNIEVAGGVRL